MTSPSQVRDSHSAVVKVLIEAIHFIEGPTTMLKHIAFVSIHLHKVIGFEASILLSKPAKDPSNSLT